jgi:RNA polymerase subunit RPABC4/transcription elongation factor Spt4
MVESEISAVIADESCGNREEMGYYKSDGEEMKIRIMATVMVGLMILSGMGFLMIPSEEENVASGQPWNLVMPRYFIGFIGNLTPQNVGSLNLTTALQITGTDTNTTPPTILGPWNVTWNMTNMEFNAEVDLDLMDYGAGWDFSLFDRYGYNETGGGLLNLPMPFNFTKTISTPHYLANGTLDFFPGVFGGFNFTVYNGTSEAPLEGVRFNFDKHYPFNSVESGLETDSSGYVEFRDMQVGLEGSSNNFKLGFDKPHFNTPDGSGFTRQFVLHEGKIMDYNFTLIEDPLVAASSPSDVSTGVRTNKSQVNIFVRFHGAMNTTSVNTNTIILEEIGGGVVDVDYTWDVSLKSVNLIPHEDLKYNTSYKLTVLPRVLDEMDTEPLWRTYSTTFTTWLKPALVSGTVLINNTTDSAPQGTTIKLDNLPIDLEDGYFSLEVREDWDHTITVWGPTVGGIDEYLYYGDRSIPYTFNIPRGAEHVASGLVVEKRDTRTLIITVEEEEGDPLEGATVTNFITDELELTDDQGQVQFLDVRKDITTPFKATYPNYFDYTFSVYAGEDNPTLKTVSLLEKPLPIEVIAAGEVYIPLEEGTTIEVDSYIRLDFENDMETETMSTDNIKIIDSEDQEVPIDVFNDTGSYKRWRVVPRSDLKYNAEYSLMVSDQVAEVGGLVNPLWRDMVITFNTEQLDSAAVNGRILVNGKGVEGVTVTVKHGDTVLGEGESELNGYYLVDIEMDTLEIFPVTIIANGSDLGLNEQTLTMRTLRSGSAINDTDFNLERLDDWIVVIYPKDEMGYMPVDGAITIRFQEELERTDLASFLENFTFGSPPVDIDVTISEDGRTVTIKPTESLDHDSNYLLYVSNFPEGEFHRELMTVSGSRALIRGETIEIFTELKPIEVILQQPSQTDIDNNNVSLIVEIYIYFSNYTVDQNKLESSIVLRSVYNNASVKNLSFTWATTGRSVGIGHDDLVSLTEYELYIPAGIYGENGARIRDPFLIHFTTRLVQDIGFKPVDVIPTDPQEAGLITVTAINTKGIAIRVVVSAVPATDLDATPFEVANFVLSPLEEKQINLDFSDKDKGEYKLILEVTDVSTGAKINDYEKNIVIGDVGETTDSDNSWIIILIIILVLVIIVAIGLFFYMQSRKKDIEEELKEEFECPECHSLVGSDDTVCPHCGAEFEEEAYKCPKCGNMLDPDDDECSECGYDFSDQDQMELDDEDEEISDMFEEEDEMELEEEEEEEEEEEIEDMEDEEEEEEEED